MKMSGQLHVQATLLSLPIGTVRYCESQKEFVLIVLAPIYINSIYIYYILCTTEHPGQISRLSLFFLANFQFLQRESYFPIESYQESSFILFTTIIEMVTL
jgi:hypothetical protein